MLTTVQAFCRSLQRAPRKSIASFSKTVNYVRLVSRAFSDLERLLELESDLVEEEPVSKRARSGAYVRRAAKRAEAVEKLTEAGLPITGLSSILRHAEKLASRNVQLAAAGAAGVALGLAVSYGAQKAYSVVAAKRKPKRVIPRAQQAADEADQSVDGTHDDVASTYTAAIAMDIARTQPSFSPALSERMTRARNQAEFLEVVSIQIELLNLQRAKVQMTYEATRRGGNLAARGVRYGAALLEGIPFVGAVVEATQEMIESACDYKVANLSVEIARLRLLRVELQAKAVPQFDREVRLRMTQMALAAADL